MAGHRVSHGRGSVQRKGEMIKQDEKMTSDKEAKVKPYGPIGPASE